MKKQILAIAIAAGLAATPLMAQAADTKVYARAHVSLDSIEVGAADAELDLNDRKSAFGIKGSEDLGGGLTVFAKMEWSVNPTDVGSAIGVRDRYIGLKKAGMGTFKFGTMSNNWKQTSAKMDPFWHTAVEMRATNASSTLSNSGGDDGGRMSNLFQFSMAPMGGIGFVVNAQLNGTGEMTTGFGIRYKAKGLYVFADTLKIENDVTTAGTPPTAGADGLSDHRGFAAGESATKFGAKYKMGALTAGITLEQSEDVTGFDYTNLMATYKVNANDTVAFTYGMAEHATSTANDKDTLAVGYIHGMSKRTSVYAAYGDGSSDTVANEHNGLSFGLKHSF